MIDDILEVYDSSERKWLVDNCNIVRNIMNKTPDQPDECRNDFEKWAAHNYMSTYKDHQGNFGQGVQICWEAFQAAWDARPVRESDSDAALCLRLMKKSILDEAIRDKKDASNHPFWYMICDALHPITHIEDGAGS